MRTGGAFSVRARGLHSWEWSRMAKAGPGSKVPYGGGGVGGQWVVIHGPLRA